MYIQVGGILAAQRQHQLPHLLVQVTAGVFGYTLDLGALGDRLPAVVDAVFAVPTILGVVTDPTTAGVGDSKQAMTYERPKK